MHMHQVVNGRKHVFEAAAKSARKQVIAGVVDELIAEGRRFLKRQTKEADGTLIWVEVSKERAAEKLGHAFRDSRKVVEKKEKGGKPSEASEKDSQAGATPSAKAATVEGGESSTAEAGMGVETIASSEVQPGATEVAAIEALIGLRRI